MNKIAKWRRLADELVHFYQYYHHPVRNHSRFRQELYHHHTADIHVYILSHTATRSREIYVSAWSDTNATNVSTKSVLVLGNHSSEVRSIRFVLIK